MGFEGNGRRTTTRLLDGEFPKYRSLLPSESLAVATVSTAQLVDSVKRVALVAERNTPVRLAFSGNELTLRAGAGHVAQKASSGSGDGRKARKPAEMRIVIYHIGVHCGKGFCSWP